MCSGLGGIGETKAEDCLDFNRQRRTAPDKVIWRNISSIAPSDGRSSAGSWHAKIADRQAFPRISFALDHLLARVFSGYHKALAVSG
jgi:hypothetical protein